MPRPVGQGHGKSKIGELVTRKTKRGYSCRINLKNHMDDVNRSVEETRPRFPGSVLVQWNHKRKGNDNRIEAMHGITKPPLTVQFASSGDQSWVGDDTPRSRRISQPLGGKLTPLTLPDHYLSSLKYTYSRFKFAFPAYCSSVSTTTFGLGIFQTLSLCLTPYCFWPRNSLCDERSDAVDYCP